MNKTISINIGGIIFHIEENAYERLKQYLETIRKHFTVSEGKDEIIADIEARIAEMLQEKIKGKREAVILQDVEDVVTVMGKPEDFGGETKEENSQQSASGSETNFGTGKKRFYRNPDDKVLGGVCSGIATYFDFDPLWLRLAFALSFFIWGSGLLFYILLWIIIPKATTTAEKLEMRGEKVNISNIEKNIKEEFEQLKNKYQNMDTSKAKNFFEKFIEFFVSLFGMLFKAIGKIIGAIFILVGVFVLVILLLMMLGSFGIASIAFPIAGLIFASKAIMMFALIGLLLVVGVPILAILFHGIRLIFNIKKTHKGFGWGATALWIIGILMLLGASAKVASEFSEKSFVKETITLQQPNTETLYLGVLENEEEEDNNSFWMINGHSHFTTDEVQLDIVKSQTENFELEKIQYARGSTKKEAKETAKNLNYSLQQKDSLLLFSPSISFNNTKWRNQEIKLLVKVPIGKTVYLQPDLEDIIYDVKNVSNTYDDEMIGHHWMMKEEGLTCLDCTGEERTANASSVNVGDSKTFDVQDFSKINIGGAYKLKIVQGEKFEVIAKGRQKDLMHLKAKVHAKELEIETDKKIWNLFNSLKTIEIFITMPELETVDLSGATSATIKGFRGEKLSLDLSGANKTNFEGDYDEIKVDVSGASKLNMEGSTKKMKVDLSGACSLDAEELKAEEVNLDLSGACSARVFVTEKITATSSGASSLHYKGNPKITNIDSDFSKVKKQD